MSKQRISELVQLLANLASVFVIVSLIGFFAYRYAVGEHQPSTANRKLHLGMHLSLPGINWSDSHSTLILALSTDCKYCRASSQFYRTLIGLNDNNRFRPIAVFPQSQVASQAYLKSENIEIPSLTEADFSGLGVDATPTLILVDEVGNVTAYWTGKLSTESEKDVIAHLGVQGDGGSLDHNQGAAEIYEKNLGSSPLISAIDLFRMKSYLGDIPVVDIRTREEYSAGHLEGTVNIPMDELGVRALHELPRNKTIFVYCHYCSPCEKKESEEGVDTFCYFGLELLRRHGFRSARLIGDDLYSLKKVGFVVTTRPPIELHLQ